ncbi:MAG: tetraacyldisaccharide 4'-kinase [Pseudomonadota bacterium]
MKAPRFWSNPPDRPGWQSRLLAPASLLWRLGATVRRHRTRSTRVDAPVLCIGNLTAGGTGKTPMVAALMDRLSARGVPAHVVSRGYGGGLNGPHLVDPLEDSANAVGDEPLLLAARGLVWVAKDRGAGARAAADRRAPLILLDDGFQNPGLGKDASIVMVDAGVGFGNGRVIPAGPLREPIDDGLDRADLTVLVGSAADRARAIDQWPVLADAIGAELSPLPTGLPLSETRVVAFAGIGRPEKFFQTLRSMGADLAEVHPFPDHHDYAPAIIRRLIARARSIDAMLVTTEKDAVRLPSALRAEVLTVMVRLELTDWARVDALLDRLLPGSAAVAQGRRGR